MLGVATGVAVTAGDHVDHPIGLFTRVAHVQVRPLVSPATTGFCLGDPTQVRTVPSDVQRAVTSVMVAPPRFFCVAERTSVT